MEYINNLMDKNGYFDKELYCGLKKLNKISKNKKIKYSLFRKLRRKFLNFLERIDD
jgi:hypothetical protein